MAAGGCFSLPGTKRLLLPHFPCRKTPVRTCGGSRRRFHCGRAVVFAAGQPDCESGPSDPCHRFCCCATCWQGGCQHLIMTSAVSDPSTKNSIPICFGCTLDHGTKGKERKTNARGNVRASSDVVPTRVRVWSFLWLGRLQQGKMSSCCCSWFNLLRDAELTGSQRFTDGGQLLSDAAGCCWMLLDAVIFHMRTRSYSFLSSCLKPI